MAVRDEERQSRNRIPRARWKHTCQHRGTEGPAEKSDDKRNTRFGWHRECSYPSGTGGGKVNARWALATNGRSVPGRGWFQEEDAQHSGGLRLGGVYTGGGLLTGHGRLRQGSKGESTVLQRRTWASRNPNDRTRRLLDCASVAQGCDSPASSGTSDGPSVRPYAH